MLFEPAPKLNQSSRPGGSDPADWDSGGAGHLGVAAGVLGEQCPEQRLPVGGQLIDEVPQGPGGVGVDGELLGPGEGIDDRLG